MQMKMVTDVQIDLYGEMQYYMASAKQGDKATRYLRIQLMNNGNEFQIPEDIILIANIKKPDGKFCYNECEREGNRVMVQLTNQALAAAGTAYCDIEMRSSNWELILSSAAFTIEIEPSMRNESAIESSNEMTFLEKKVQHYIDRMIQTENQVLTTENAVKIAEHARCLAEQGRVDAEDIRVENENARILGEKGREKQETERQRQEEERQESTENAVTKTNAATESAKEATKECLDIIERAEGALSNEEQLEDVLKTVQDAWNEVETMQAYVDTARKAVESIWNDIENIFENEGIMVGATPNEAGRAGLVPAPPAGSQSGKYLRGDGTWQTPPDTNTTYGNMQGSSQNAAGRAGLVPAPTAGAANRYLRNDGTWAVPPDNNTVYSHPINPGNKHIPAGGSSGQILRWSADGTAAWGADNNTTYGPATQLANGLMSAADKKKLDEIAAGANKTTVDSTLSATSTNPVQNKAVKAELDKKVTGAGLTFSVVNGILTVTY